MEGKWLEALGGECRR